MLFNSFEYLIFLPIVFLLYWFVCKSGKQKNLFLIAASYLFYGWWNLKLLFLIIAITLIAYLTAGYIDNSPKSERLRRRIALVFNLIVNIGILFLFKYFDFFASGFAKILLSIGFTPDIPTLNLILPVGISFYTFQAMGYVIDVYRGKIGAEKDPVTFFVFISFFPQLVAGPIERATNLLPQFRRNKRRFTYKRGVEGMQLILWGLFKKMVVADNAAVIVNEIFKNWESVGTINLWIGALLFSFQIYCDFSGYSDIAIGSAKLFGIDLCANFRLPYFSRDIAEFWKRWHISLTSWFRDYIYIPLGGNRKGKLKTIRNTIVVFLTSGLWHGANLTFVIWGAYHALLFVPLLIFGKTHRYKTEQTGKYVTTFRETAMMGVTMLLVMIGWVIFRAETATHAFNYIAAMFSNFSMATQIMGKRALAWVLILIAIEWITKFKSNPLQFSNSGIFKYRMVKWSIYLLIFCVTIICAGNTQDFIYFKF